MDIQEVFNVVARMPSNIPRNLFVDRFYDALGNRRNDFQQLPQDQQTRFIIQARDRYYENTRIPNQPTPQQESSGYEMPKGLSKLTQTAYAALSGAEAEYMPSIGAEMVNTSDVFKSLFTEDFKKLEDLPKLGEKLMNYAQNSIKVYAEQQSALLTIFNERVGMTGTLSEQFRKSLTDANPKLLQLGIGFNDLANSAKSLVESTGKFATLNQRTWEDAGVVAKAYVGTLDGLVGLFPQFQEIGLGASDTTKAIQRIGKESLSVGIQSQKTISLLKTDIGKLNEYGFKNGIDGLANMAKKAIELRMNLTDVYKIAEKVMSPEGAIDLAANLQVLGGAIGDFNDPLKLMYMATNNVEGLQDALANAAGSLATYNSEQGRFEITGINLRKAREMANQFGMSMSDLNKIAVATAERTSAASEIAARGLKLNDKDREFITNIAQMKEGRMVVELGASNELKKYFGDKSEVALEELSQDQLDTLINMRKTLEKPTEEEIVRDQANSVRQLGRDVSYIVALMRTTGGKSAENLYRSMFEELGTSYKTIKDNTSSLVDKIAPYIKNAEIKDIDDLKKRIMGLFDEKQKEEKKSTPVRDAFFDSKTKTTIELPTGQLLVPRQDDNIMIGTNLTPSYKNLSSNDKSLDEIKKLNNDIKNQIDTKNKESVLLLNQGLILLNDKLNKKEQSKETKNTIINPTMPSLNLNVSNEKNEANQDLDFFDSLLKYNFDTSVNTKNIFDLITNKKIEFQTPEIKTNIGENKTITEVNKESVTKVEPKIEKTENINTPINFQNLKFEQPDLSKFDYIYDSMRNTYENNLKEKSKEVNKNISGRFVHKFEANSGITDEVVRRFTNSPQFYENFASKYDFLSTSNDV